MRDFTRHNPDLAPPTRVTGHEGLPELRSPRERLIADAKEWLRTLGDRVDPQTVLIRKLVTALEDASTVTWTAPPAVTAPVTRPGLEYALEPSDPGIGWKVGDRVKVRYLYSAQEVMGFRPGGMLVKLADHDEDSDGNPYWVDLTTDTVTPA